MNTHIIFICAPITTEQKHASHSCMYIIYECLHVYLYVTRMYFYIRIFIVYAHIGTKFMYSAGEKWESLFSQNPANMEAWQFLLGLGLVRPDLFTWHHAGTSV